MTDESGREKHIHAEEAILGYSTIATGFKRGRVLSGDEAKPLATLTSNVSILVPPKFVWEAMNEFVKEYEDVPFRQVAFPRRAGPTYWSCLRVDYEHVVGFFALPDETFIAIAKYTEPGVEIKIDPLSSYGEASDEMRRRYAFGATVWIRALQHLALGYPEMCHRVTGWHISKMFRKAHNAAPVPVYELHVTEEQARSVVAQLLKGERTMADRLRVAVIGGDDRIAQESGWPEHIDVKTYTGSQKDMNKLITAVQAAKIDRIVVLTRWMSHAIYSRVKAAAQAKAQVYTWPFGIARLAAEMPQLLGELPDREEVPAAGSTPAFDADTATWSDTLREILSLDKRGYQFGEIVDLAGVEAGSDAATSISAVLTVLIRLGEVEFVESRYRRVVAEEKEPEMVKPAQSLPSPESKPIDRSSKFMVAEANGKTYTFNDLETALQTIATVGGGATLWKQVKTRTKVEIDE